MAGIKWTKQEDRILKNKYGKFNKYKLLKVLPKRTWDAIKIRAEKNGLKYCNGVHYSVEADLSILLKQKNISYYWMGFLAADGTFSKSSRLKLTLAVKDKKHLIKFANFIKCKNLQYFKNKEGYELVSISVQDKFTIPLIMKKFDLKLRKTYNPPNLTWIKNNYLLSFIAGFIDGDGSIIYMYKRKDCRLCLKNHSSWLSCLQFMCDYIYDLFNYKKTNAIINNHGYAYISISNNTVLRKLKKKLKSLKLPLLNRKWNKINLNMESRYIRAKRIREKLLKLKNKKIDLKQVSKKLGISEDYVRILLKRIK